MTDCLMYGLTGPGTGREESRKSIDLGQPDLALQDDIIDEVSSHTREAYLCLSIDSIYGHVNIQSVRQM